MPRGGARPGAGRKRKSPPAIEIAATPNVPAGEPAISGDSPLEFLLEVMKSSEVRLSVRMQAAAIAAPFMHGKPPVAGKKDEKAGAAKKAASGKFAAAAPPLKLVGGPK